jgi:hypothetical protein
VIRDTREVVREEPLVRDRLLVLLRGGAMTVPELAAEAGLPPEEVMTWVMGMRRYGHVSVEKEPTEEGYYRYAAVGEP